ncbi:MAG TPA: hypothetical protein DD444_09630 [Citreicella sp.]|nr:hypothetical protein [Citreicella sp.]
MIRLPLLALLLLTASPALALKCLAPDPARDFRAAEADSATWSGVYGWLEVLSHPEGAGPGQARLTGRSLTTEGFSQPFDRDIALQVSCLGPWCGQVESGPVAALLRHGRAGLVLQVEPCRANLWPDPEPAQIQSLSACMAGACD